MKYWVYINEKVEGPFTEDKLVTLQGFTPDTLICSEEAANSGRQEWVKASNVFEFDQVQLPQAGASHNAASALNSDELTSMLLSKLDALTTQLTGMQDKLDNMGTKLDESITTQQKTAEEAAARADALANQVSNIVAARNVDPTKEAAKDAVLAPTLDSDQTQEKPLDMLGPVDLGTADSPSITSADAATNEVSDSEDDALVLSSALNSLQAKKQSEEEKENTFRDLLTPAQAEELAKQGTPAPAEKTSAQQKQEEQKEAVLAEFAAPSSSDESVLDEVIKEKEAEKENTKPSISKRWMAAGAAALAGAATLFTKKSDGKDTTKDADQELTPAAEKPSLDMEQTPQNISALGEAEEPKPSQSEIPAITENSQEAKSEESTEGASPEQITVDLATLPTTDESVMQNVANEPAS
ncbi:MAG: hypothetical protein IKO35_00100, partial [Elusimicrobiaceae bacterium]|nr:hypothetical protein [Elusimicrobiaceae bacterium]